uniref:Uncharacterized protein n=1 Tax=Romanomermis culicivorax TaxID=13658 RepID=A0A915JVM6_ROMCU
GPGASTSFGYGASYRQQNDQQSSPRLFSNILDHFRQKSKTDGKSSKKKFIVKPVSENEHKTDLLIRVKGSKMTAEEMRRQKMASDMLSVYATIHGGMRPPMTTIPSVDEDSKMDSTGVALPSPLFVDTHLANHETSTSTSTWRQKAHSLSARNALGSLGFGRHHKEKSLQQQHDHRKRSASGNAEGQ